MKANRLVLALASILFFLSGAAAAQDLARIVTKADVEKVTGAKFQDGTKPMPSQMLFMQEGGDLQLSVEVEPRDVASTVRSWEATIRKMQPNQKVDTIPGVGKDAIYFSARPDSGALSADYDKPRVQLRVAIVGAKTPAQAKQMVVTLAKIVGPRVGK